MGFAIQKAGVSENKNFQAHIHFMTYDRSPAALEILSDVNLLAPELFFLILAHSVYKM